MDNAVWPLPIRLVPRRGAQIFRIVFFTFFVGFALFWIAMAASGTWFADGDRDGGHWAAYLFPLFGLIFVGIGGMGLAEAIAKLLPGSPYHHLLISGTGLTIRTMWRAQRHAWAELSPFDVSVRTRRDKNGHIRYSYYVVALPAADAEKLADENERYNRSVFRIDADEFGADSAATDAADLAAWFNTLRESALDRRLSAAEPVSVPPGFRASIWAGAEPSNSIATPASAKDAAPIIEQADKRDGRPPTVVRR